MLFAAQADVADHIDQLAEAMLIEPRVGVILRQHTFEPRVVALDRHHRVVDDLTDHWVLRAVAQI